MRNLMKTYMLWHPESPGVKVLVRRPALLRRLGIIRSDFATIREVLNTDNTVIMTSLSRSYGPVDVDQTRRYFRRYS